MTFQRQCTRGLFVTLLGVAFIVCAAPAFAPPPGGGNGNGNGGGGGGGGDDPPADPAITFTKDFETLSVMNADGSNETEIFQGEPLLFDPSWSPDGVTIAFTHGSGGGSRALWLIDVEVVDGMPQGTNARYLAGGGSDPGAYDPAWSPLGDEIVFGTIADGHKLWTISPAGGAPTLLYAAQPDWYIWGPEWSPDGLFIAFIEWPTSGASLIKIIDSLTGQVIDVFEPDPAPRIELSWARTQNVIAYDAEKPSNRWLKADVWALDLSDGSVSLIVEDGAWPSWSADDTQLVYQTVGRRHDVKVLDFATGESTNLTKGNHPDWRYTP